MGTSGTITGYHVTTPKKLERYKATGCILPPVRFWLFRNSAEAWAKKTGRTVILEIPVKVAYPLPDHKPTGHAAWTPEMVRKWAVVETDVACTTVDDYAKLPWTIDLHRDGNCWFAQVVELPGCMSDGDTVAVAYHNLRVVLPLWLKGAMESGYSIPVPIALRGFGDADSEAEL